MAKIAMAEVKKIAQKLKSTFPINSLKQGMEIEMEHRDITGGDLTQTAKIALAHLKENPKYYSYLLKMEKQMKKTEKGKN